MGHGKGRKSLRKLPKASLPLVDTHNGGLPGMSAQTIKTRSDETVVEHLLFLTPNQVVGRHVGEELASAGLYFEEAHRGLRVAVGDVDWKALLEGISETLSDDELRNTRVALIPRDADETAMRKAVIIARSFTEILENYSDAWLCELMQQKGLVVHLQPLVQYPPGRIHGYECLVRGIGANEKLLPPERLFEAVGRLEMEYLLDQQACKAAIATAAEVGFSNIQYFINIMPGAVADPMVHAQSLLAAVELGGLRADQITFELVQSEGCRDRKKLRRIIDSYHEAGFNVSLDDVGAGAVSLLSLSELCPEYIKLDGELCRRAAESPSHAALVKDLIEAARQHGVIAIAKGIETEEQLRFVMDAGARVTQGHVHAHPAATPLSASDEDFILRQARRTAILALD
jgi:EAL domain-containing protein (putative c-di-GMP-specific phosphodiesterase class I)